MKGIKTMINNSKKQTARLRKLFLSSMLTLSLIVPSFAIPDMAHAATFKDIKNHWAEGYIEKAVAKGLVKGFPDGTFKPNQPVTRAEFTAMVNRMLGNSGYGNTYFKDVARSEWYYNDIAKAAYAGYVGGDSDGTFKPLSPASRQEAAIMISRFLPVAGINSNVSGFTDASGIANWALEGVGKVRTRGYLDGYPDGRFHPEDSITRAMLAKILCNISDKESIVTSRTSVSSNGTMLSNRIYSNDVVIESSLGNGNATLDNCVVLGQLTVNGGGENSIRLNNSRIANMSTNKSGTPVRILASSHTVVANSNISNRAILETSNLSGGLFGSGFKEVTISRNAEAALRGSFPYVKVDGYDARLDLQSGTITKLEATTSATNAKINVANRARINTADASARVSFTGDGYVDELNAKASGITYGKKPGRINVSSGASYPTEDLNANLEIEVTPKHKSTNVSRSSDITIRFKNSVTDLNGRVPAERYMMDNIELRKDRQSGSIQSWRSASISRDNRTITLDPRYDFDNDATYYIIVKSRTFEYADRARNSEQVTYFSTGGSTKIGDATVYPRDGATGVSKNTDITFTFDEAIELANGRSMTNSNLSRYITLRKNNSSGSNVRFDASIDRYNKVITIDPRSSLDDGQKYYVYLDASGFRTVSGNRSIRAGSSYFTVGNKNDIRISFSTSSTNTQFPTITVYFGTRVYRNSSRSTFNTNNDSSALNAITLSSYSGSFDATFNSNQDRLSITPKSSLDAGRSYTLRIRRGYFYDYDGRSNSEASTTFTISTNLNKNTLNDRINTADTHVKSIDNSLLDKDPSKLVKGTFSVTTAEKNALVKALSSARSTYSNATTQTQIDNAASNLYNAISAFETAKAKGQGTKDPENLNNLKQYISDAKKLKSSVTTSSTGVNVDPSNKWVTQSEMDALNSAILSAENYAKDLNNQSLSKTTEAENQLNAAIDKFKNVLKDGKQPQKTELKKSIDSAKSKLELYKLAVNAEDVNAGEHYVTASERGSFAAAIEKAQTAYSNSDLDQSQVDAAKSELDDAIKTFDTAYEKNVGTKFT